MDVSSRQLARLALILLMVLTGTAWGQDKAACDSPGKIKTPQLVEGRVSDMDRSQGKLTLLDGDGKAYQFLASHETLQEISIGDRIKAKLREVPKCGEK